MVQAKTIVVDGLETSYLEAGDGPPIVLLHGGEFGASAGLAWERVIEPLAASHRVVAPDILGFGASAKVVDFADGRGIKLRHLAALCGRLGISEADFVGNSMGAVMLLIDSAAGRPVLPVRRMVTICGGGEILENEHSAALYDYDGSLEGMRRIVGALFHDEAYLAEGYVQRRHASSLVPGAWEAVASARFRRPGHVSAGGEPAYERITRPTLVVEGACDKLKPRGWAAGIAARIPGASATVIAGSGHCPQIEQPEETLRVLRGFLEEGVPAR
ncbi:alpha/beta hydrolase [Microbacterium lushaniae]|nr:alpha/beta hydrolase [Microbacterium lushaniae]KAA9151580.1 alpha/beta hydrolase [Microbacterium lushaniae]